MIILSLHFFVTIANERDCKCYLAIGYRLVNKKP